MLSMRYANAYFWVNVSIARTYYKFYYFKDVVFVLHIEVLDENICSSFRNNNFELHLQDESLQNIVNDKIENDLFEHLLLIEHVFLERRKIEELSMIYWNLQRFLSTHECVVFWNLNIWWKIQYIDCNRHQNIIWREAYFLFLTYRKERDQQLQKVFHHCNRK